MTQPHLDGIRSARIPTARLDTHLLSCGDPAAAPVIFVHGNFSAATYFEELMLALSPHFYCLAPDLRGYGDSEPKGIDATRGARDLSDDLWFLMQSLNIERAHFLGWSLGAAPIVQLAIDRPGAARSLCLVAPVSPFGYGGSKNVGGEACYEDGAGSGGGAVPADFVARIAAKDTGRDDDFSPRNVIAGSFFYKPIKLAREDQLLAASLQQVTGTDHYPGDFKRSDNWPYVAPGQRGPINAISVRYLDLSHLIDAAERPPVLWIRGDRDVVISDNAAADFGTLGKMGVVENWPGEEVYPPQPMVAQMRQVLERYRVAGGDYRERVMRDVGHSPFLEKPAVFLRHYTEFLRRIRAQE